MPPMIYETPQVRDYGQLVDVTAGQSDGQALDGGFPILTPKSSLTFS